MKEPELTPAQAREVLRAAGVRCAPEVARLKRYNDVWRLTCDNESFYLKTYTKDWYRGEVAQTSYCVDHEAAAYRLLANTGLATPEVMAAEPTLGNPLGRPYLLTRGLAGRSLTEVVMSASSPERDKALENVGVYMAAMHTITLGHAGYIFSDGPAQAPDPNEWQHPIWTIGAFLAQTRATWDEDRSQVSVALFDRREALLTEGEKALAAAYQPPRFTHGDCHAHQFFGEVGPDGNWRVTGVIDMEVASAGDCGADLVKFFLEMAARLPATTRWWQAFFTGYGSEVDLALLQLRMLAAHHVTYTCLGPNAWPGSRSQIAAHILAAQDWEGLLDTRRIV